METILKIRDLTVSFNYEGKRIEILSSISLEVGRGRIVCLVGESGCGKTVTALSVMRLLPKPGGKVDGGEINFDGVDLLKLSEDEIRRYRGAGISMIFQDPVSSLNPVFTVGEQIAEALRTHKIVDRKDERKKVVELLEMVGIPSAERRYDSYPHELSGGMCQRVMIAMALSCNPKLLIADEPTTALDVTIQASILDLILKLRDELSMSVLLITHDLGIVSEVGDDVYVLYAGRVVESGSVDQIFTLPSHPYTRGLIDSIPSIYEKKEKLEAIPGFIPSPGNFPKGCRFNTRCSIAEGKCFQEEPPLYEVEAGHFSACYKYEETKRIDK